MNLGFGWDRIQNLLWRLEHGELAGLPHPPAAVLICIGTNNTSETPNARANTAAEIAEGVLHVCAAVRAIVGRGSGCRIILTEILPREACPNHPRRQLIVAANKLIRKGIRLTRPQQQPGQAMVDEVVDLVPVMLGADGVLAQALSTGDYCHPSEGGYGLWAEALRPLLPPAVPMVASNSISRL